MAQGSARHTSIELRHAHPSVYAPSAHANGFPTLGDNGRRVSFSEGHGWKKITQLVNHNVGVPPFNGRDVWKMACKQHPPKQEENNATHAWRVRPILLHCVVAGALALNSGIPTL